MIQGSEEWKMARLGCFSSSTAKELMTKGRGGKPSKTRDTLICKLIAERLTGQPNDSAETYAMARGAELEAEARAAYIMAMGVEVAQIGFLKHSDLAYCGTSIDGLVGEKGGIEIKCPLTEWRHVQSLEGVVDDDYTMQRQWHMWVVGLEWLDAVSFHPAFPTHAQMARVRIEPDKELHAQFRAAVIEGNAEIEQRLAKLTQQQAA